MTTATKLQGNGMFEDQKCIHSDLAFVVSKARASLPGHKLISVMYATISHAVRFQVMRETVAHCVTHCHSCIPSD